jgi:hypothetical protein
MRITEAKVFFFFLSYMTVTAQTKLQGNALTMLEMEAQIDTWHT